MQTILKLIRMCEFCSENFLQPNYRVSNTEQAQDQNSRDFVSSGLSMVDPASVVNQLLDDTHLFEEPPLPNNWAVEVTEQVSGFSRKTL